VFFSKEQIEQSVRRLNDITPFFGTTFLAFKQAHLPVGKTANINSIPLLDSFLRKYYHPVADYRGFYTPFKTWNNQRKRWNSHLYANSLHVNAGQRFSDILIHPGGGEWGWQTDYITIIKTKYLKENLLPAFDLAVWLFHARQWPRDVKSEDIVEEFFTEFSIRDNERVLFTSAPVALANPWLRETPLNNDELLEIISPPPGRITEGALLQKLVLIGVGPAEKFELDFAPRLNLITGDNALGKTFLLECAWWALTGNWIDYPAKPRQEAESPSIAFQIGQRGRNARLQTIKYKWDQLTWDMAPKRNTLPGLSIFAQIDGSFAVWDPNKYRLASEEHYAGRPTDALTRFSRTSVLQGLNETDRYGNRQKVAGLINDWIRWQEAADQTRFEELSAALYALSPRSDPYTPSTQADEELLVPGRPGRMPDLTDTRDIPTLRFPYGEVLLTHCSAGVQRIVSLAYLLIWAWQEHLKATESIRGKPSQSLVLLIDEMEAHLHPLWQRTILPAVMNVVQEIASEVQIQLMVVTHSPLVLASVEPIFDNEQDKLFHLYLKDGSVHLDDPAFVKRGRSDYWLTSDIFGLEQPRSIAAEKAINEANKLQLEKEPSQERIRDVSNRLVSYLAPDDEYWPLWTYFAKKREVNL
jgi:hypothetical protein